MQCLWLTWIDPCPEHDGQRIYSGRLIEALARAGANIDVLTFANSASHRRDGSIDDGVRWHLAPEDDSYRPWQSVFSRLPHIAHRPATRTMRERLQALLEARDWDCVIFDGLAEGWALAPCTAHYAKRARRPRFVHISHNHEESTRAGVARNYAGNPVRKQLIRHDAEKAGALERRLVDGVDLVTAITPEDALKFSGRSRTPVIVLQPGYAGRRVERRHIGPQTPRRAILAGSFDWIAKQMNLREFLAAAEPLFAMAGAELQIVGGGNETFLEEMRRQHPAADITGRVPDIAPYFDKARIAIVPELSGGGFKLKVLDYVFNRVPVAALKGSVAGMPLKAGESILLSDGYRQLAEAVLKVVDDFTYLNDLQQRAYAACTHAFEWRARGTTLLSSIAALEGVRDDAAA